MIKLNLLLTIIKSSYNNFARSVKLTDDDYNALKELKEKSSSFKLDSIYEAIDYVFITATIDEEDGLIWLFKHGVKNISLDFKHEIERLYGFPIVAPRNYYKIFFEEGNFIEIWPIHHDVITLKSDTNFIFRGNLVKE